MFEKSERTEIYALIRAIERIIQVKCEYCCNLADCEECSVNQIEENMVILRFEINKIFDKDKEK